MEVDKISSKNWSISTAGLGEVVEELEDIGQAVLIVLTTQKGSDPLRPFFGCDVLKWIDRPTSVAVPNLIASMKEALESFEPRIDPETIRIQHEQEEGDPSRLVFSVNWQTVNRSQSQTTSVTYG